MTRFIFHIGPERTGSTYLQHCLRDSHADLIAKGIFFADPLAPEEASPSVTRDLPRLLSADGEERPLADMFRHLAEGGYDTVLISCPALSSIEEPGFARLRAALADHPAEFVFYVRRWSDRLASCWNFEVQQGSFRSLPEFAMGFFDTDLQSAQIDYTRIWGPIVAIFGREALHLICYSQLRDKDIDIYKHFYRRYLGLKQGLSSLPAQVLAPSLSPEDIEILRVLNEMTAGSDPGGARPRPIQLDDPALEPVRAAIRQNFEPMEFNDRSGWFETAFARISAYADRVVGGAPAVGMFKRKYIVQDCVRPDYLVEPGILAALEAVNAAAGEGPP